MTVFNLCGGKRLQNYRDKRDICSYFVPVCCRDAQRAKQKTIEWNMLQEQEFDPQEVFDRAEDIGDALHEEYGLIIALGRVAETLTVDAAGAQAMCALIGALSNQNRRAAGLAEDLARRCMSRGRDG